MGIKERLAVIEARLGIEPPDDGFGSIGIFWDSCPSGGRSFDILVDDEDGNDTPFDGEMHWDHFVALPKEVIDKIAALGIPLPNHD